MSMARGVMGSIVGGVIGAALWTAVAYFSHLEIGWIAWGVGLLAGLGMAAAGGRGAGAGALAAVIAIGSVVGGKYLTVHAEVGDLVHDAHANFSDQDAKAFLAGEIMAEYERQGRMMPPAADGDYPAEVWDDANAQWASMSRSDRAAYINHARETTTAELKDSTALLEVLGMIGSFGLFDLLWLGLGVSTAYKVGSAGRRRDGDAATSGASEPVEFSPLDRFAPPAGETSSSAKPSEPVKPEPVKPEPVKPEPAVRVGALESPPIPATRDTAPEPPRAPIEQFRIPGAPPLTPQPAPRAVQPGPDPKPGLGAAHGFDPPRGLDADAA